MLRNYFIIAWRNLWKNKLFSVINVIGLSVAFGSGLLLFLTARFELSFDSFHKDNNQIFRFAMQETNPSLLRSTIGTAMAAPLAPTIKNEYPEIEYIARRQDGGGMIEYKDKKLEESLDFVDADYLQMFSFQMLKGSTQTALKDLGNVVIKADLANALFGEENPIGKSVNLTFGGQTKGFIVSGVLQNPPDNSTLDYDALVRFENSPEYKGSETKWDNQYHDVFIKLPASATAASFEKKIRPFTRKYYAENIRSLKRDGAKADGNGEYLSLKLQPLSDIHFNSFLKEGNAHLYPYILLTISLLIVAIAAINFINLSVARSLTRTREVGMRKVLGAHKWQIVGQFWGEALLIGFCSLLFGLLLAQLLLPEYKAAFRTEISLTMLQSVSILAVILTIFLLVTGLAGGYPAWFINRFNTMLALKGKISAGRSNHVRSSLIVVQFVIATLLIISTLIISQQIRFLRNKPLGFNTKQVISIPVNSKLDGGLVLQRLRNELAGQPAIESVTGASNNLGRGKDGSSWKSVMGFEYNNRSLRANNLSVDYDFVKTMELKILAGRDFSRQFATDSTQAILINETFAKQIGGNPLGVWLPVHDSTSKLQVIGIVKDYHFESLHAKVESQMIELRSKDFPVGYLFVKVANQNMPQTMALLENTWKKIAPEDEFLGSFLDENTNRQYRKEERFYNIFITAAGLAIVLSCIGLFAIALLVMTQRTKEIGIRKVLGASTSGIVALLSKDFIKLVLIAFAIATPIGWYVMNQWLQDFAYKIDISWWIFVSAGILAVTIALVTVSYQAIKAALANPVKSLRSE